MEPDEVVVEGQRERPGDQDHEIAVPRKEQRSNGEPEQYEQVGEGKQCPDQEDPGQREPSVLGFGCFDDGDLSRVVIVCPERGVDVRGACEPRKDAAGPREEDDLEVLDPERLAAGKQDVPVADPDDELDRDPVGEQKEDVRDQQDRLCEEDQPERGKGPASLFVIYRNDEIHWVGSAIGHFHLDRA